MWVPSIEPRGRRLLRGALVASVLAATLFVGLSWTRILLTGRAPAGASDLLLGLATGLVLATASFVPFLLATLLVVAVPSRRTIAGGAVLVYVADLLLTVGQSLASGFPRGVGLPVLAVPLTRVVLFLAVATAVALAYHGGYERLDAALGVDQHPLYAHVADTRLRDALTLHRGLVVAALAGLVSAGGLVLAGAVADALRALARLGASGSTPITFVQPGVWQTGISLARLPVEWLYEASFLLGVLFVTGPRPGRLDLLKGGAAIVGIQATVRLLVAFLPPREPVYLFDPSGPILAPLGGVILLVGIASAVRVGLPEGASPAEGQRE